MNLAAALEDSIIRKVRPKWNATRRKRDSKLVTETSNSAPATERELEDLVERPSPESTASFSVVLHPTYLKTGFFNVRVDHESYIGNDGETIEIFCGRAKRSIFGTINRRANRNQTPRIMGGQGLRDWFQENVPAMHEFKVFVVTPTEIRVEI
jgi:hypothetical protein